MKLSSPPTALAASSLLVLGVLLAPCLSVAEEVYRWVDEEGRVHFSSTPPPSGSARKPEKWEGSERDVINVVPETGAPPPTPRARRGNTARPGPSLHGAAPPRRRPAEGAERIGGKSEMEWRTQAQDLQRRVEDLEAQLERTEDGPEFFEKGYYDNGATRYAENKASRIRNLQRQIEEAEDRLDEFEDKAREAGVPPGWLR